VRRGENLAGVLRRQLQRMVSYYRGSCQKRLGELPVPRFIDVRSFTRVHLEPGGLRANPAATTFETVAGEDVEVAVLLVERGKILGGNKPSWLVIQRASIGIIEPTLVASNGKDRVVPELQTCPVSTECSLEGLRSQEGVRRVSLHEVMVIFKQLEIVRDDPVHGNLTPAQLVGTPVDRHFEVVRHEIRDLLAVRIDDDPFDISHTVERFQDPQAQRLSTEWFHVFLGDPLAVPLHRQQRGPLLRFARA